MKRIPFIVLVAVTVTAWTGCKRVEVLPDVSNAILPLALGNSWTYVDSFATQVTADSIIQQFVEEITYTVEAETHVDLITETGGKRIVQRLPGWKIGYQRPEGRTSFGLFLKGDSLFVETFIRYSNGSPFPACEGFEAYQTSGPASIPANSGFLRLALVYPLANQTQFVATPAFREHTGCLPMNITTMDGEPLKFKLFIRPLELSDPPLTIVTAAGSFASINYGNEWWSPGIGLVRAVQTGTAAYHDTNYQLQTGSMTWTRTLKAYHFN